MALDYIVVYCMKKLIGHRWQWERKQHCIKYLITKPFLANYLGILHVSLTVDQVCTALGPKTPRSLKIHILELRLGKWILNIKLHKVEQFEEMYKIRMAGPFCAI